MKTRIIQNQQEDPVAREPNAGRHSAPAAKRNLGARMGRWSARHRKKATLVWLALVIAAFGLKAALPMKVIDKQDAGVGEARRADKMIDAAFGKDKHQLGEFVIVQSTTKTVDDPEFRGAVDETLTALGRFKQVENLRSPFAAGNAGQISSDRRTALIQFSPHGAYKDAVEYIDDISAAVTDVQKQHPDLYVSNAGVSSEKALNKTIDSGIVRAGLIAIPLTLAILLLVTGSLTAALVPVVLALTAVFAALGLVSLPSYIVPMDSLVSEVILLIGLAVGVDYSLFYLRRERDERRAGRSETAALEAAAATSGRAVLVSGFTVLIAMAGMFFTGDKTFISFALGAMIVVATAMIGSLTVLPAILSKLGDRIEKGRVPLLHRFRRDDGEGSRFWRPVLRASLRRPWVSAAAAAGLLIVLALPALRLHTADSGLDSLPKSMKELQSFHRIDDAFPGDATAATIAIKSRNTPRLRQAIANLKTRALASGEMSKPFHVDRSSDGSLVTVDVPLAGEGTDRSSNHALETLRSDILPATVGTVPGAVYAVTGKTARSKDYNDRLKATAPIVFAFVLAFAFVLLLVAFRSIVVALKAILLNLLSVAAAYGILVAVFQWGWGENLLDFNRTGGITSWLPMFLFVILFGLSMDYHVFILSRIREAVGRGMSTEQAVEHGILASAGVVTGAATVMVAVFSVFVMLPLLDLKEMGAGLAAAILIDATLVRAVLLPATMKLLGDKNWYLPGWLEWLPSLEHDRPERKATSAPALGPAT
jgi:RND superfamily putative drug exporter